MKKNETLYDWPISELTRLADSDIAEAFYNGLRGAASNAFVKLTENICGLRDDLAAAKTANQHFPSWDDVRSCVETFEQEFSQFPDSVFRRLRLFIAVAQNVASVGGPLDMVDIDPDVFSLQELSQPLPIIWFHRENAVFDESCCVLSCTDMPTLEKQVVTANISPRFAFQLLGCLNRVADVPLGHVAMVRTLATPATAVAVEAFARLLVLSSGATIHSSRRYTLPPRVLDPDCIRVGEPYQQWNDVLNVLSEYNARDDLLLKYLTIYHTVENFMFKRPIVELEGKLGGRMFSIRDFRRLYQQVETRELDALKDLFRVVAPIGVKGGRTFTQHWANRWSTIVPPAMEKDVNVELASLGVGFKYRDVRANTAPSQLAALVYSVRNAVVHNKETEFHLTYATLSPAITLLMEEFLIPTLEEVCFEVVGRRNAELWYSQDKLVFYR